MRRARSEAGFTTVELIVGVTLMLLVFGAVLTVFETFQRDTRYGQLRNETQDNARNALDRLARELRNVAAPTTGASGEISPGALEVAEPYALTFQTVDASKTSSGLNTTNAMRLRYCLDDTNPEREILWRQYKRWETAAPPAVPATTACPDNVAGHFEGKQKLVDYVVNRIGGKTTRKLFKYTPASWTQVSEIVSVEPTLFIDLKPGQRPGESQLTSSIALRNENRLPVATFNAVQLAGHKVLLNASESTDPDGLALTYEWWDNGAEMPSTGQQVETAELVVNSTHVFKLVVRDPGGLKAETEKTVVIKP